MGIILSTERSDAIQEAPPTWPCNLQLTPDNNQDRLSSFSDGFYSLNANTVVRQREGSFHSDGARWSRGFTSGKHVFTIVYPECHRGTEASVGVGLMKAPLFSKGRVTLVGLNKSSWGIDLRTKRAVHAGKVVKKYPQTQVPLPDTFDMYLDMDSGMLQFSSDEGFHGSAITGIKMKTGGEPVYPMVSAVTPGSTIGMYYKGEAVDPTLLYQNPQTVQIVQPPNNQQVIIQQQTVQQPMYPQPVQQPMYPQQTGYQQPMVNYDQQNQQQPVACELQTTIPQTTEQQQVVMPQQQQQQQQQEEVAVQPSAPVAETTGQTETS